MQFLTTAFAATCALATVASAQYGSTTSASVAIPSSSAGNGVVHWVSQDDQNRQIVCTPQVGQPPIESFEVKAGQTVNQTFPHAWIGNCYAICEGDGDTPGMLAEFRWNGWQNINFYDVSAIVNASDTNNIQTLFPLGANEPMSGCPDGFPCDSVYIHPDDIQTQSTTENVLVCTLGVLKSQKSRKRNAPVRRSYVLGELNEM